MARHSTAMPAAARHRRLDKKTQSLLRAAATAADGLKGDEGFARAAMLFCFERAMEEVDGQQRDLDTQLELLKEMSRHQRTIAVLARTRVWMEAQGEETDEVEATGVVFAVKRVEKKEIKRRMTLLKGGRA